MGLHITNNKSIIAIVDDDESVCRAIKRLVRSLGMEADTFTSGRSFLDFIEAMPSRKFDCIVLDVQMPGLNGLEVQDRLKKNGCCFPVIFITAHDQAGVREQALMAGALAFVRKPFEDELLIKTLRAAFETGAPGKGSI